MSLNFTSDSSSFPASLTLELSLSKSPPDLLGFSEVSGLYGPGTWAAWFLVIVASWLHLLYLLAEIEIKLDINMWAYLLGLNWAAVDLIRHSRHLSSQYYAGIGSEQWSKEAASVGAALTMVFWGSCGALAQLLLCWSGTSSEFLRPTKGYWRRVYVLALGLLLPCTSLIAIGPYLGLWQGGPDDHAVADLIPALYWKGMNAAPGGSVQFVRLVGHLSYLQLITLLGIWGFVLCFCLVVDSVLHLFPSRLLRPVVRPLLHFLITTVDYVLPLWDWALSHNCLWYFTFALQLSFTLAFTLLAMVFFFCFVTLGLPFCMITLMIFPFFFFLSVVYVFKAYLFGSSHSVSCFFMPCAPQSISETDQAGTLFVGLALFVGVEILPPLYATFKKRYVEGRQFEQSVDRSITNGAMRRLVDGSLRSLVGGNGPVPTTRRVNSGIELEEGVYSGS